MVKGIRTNRYQILIEHIFFEKWSADVTKFDFERADLERVAKDIRMALPKNLGDVMYALRYRIGFPPRVIDTQPPGLEWIIEGAGRAKYSFRLVKKTRILPRQDLARILIPDATPEIIKLVCSDDLRRSIRYQNSREILTRKYPSLLYESEGIFRTPRPFDYPF